MPIFNNEQAFAEVKLRGWSSPPNGRRLPVVSTPVHGGYNSISKLRMTSALYARLSAGGWITQLAAIQLL